MTTHYLWDTYLKLLANGMADQVARAKLREIFPADAAGVDAILAARGDTESLSDPANDPFLADIRDRALGGRHVIEMTRDEILALGEKPL